MKDLLINAAVSAIIAGLIVLFFAGSPSGTLGAVSRAPNVDAEFKSLTLTGVDEDTSVAFTSGISNFSGLLTLNAGQLRSYTSATSTAASMTLRVSDVVGYDTIIVTPTGAASAKTLTFFASSTASTWLPAAGDRQETCFINSTTTAATTLIFAAGTGIDMEVATSTNNGGGAYDLTISAGGMGCFTFVRGAATASAFDIHAGLVEFSDAD